MLSRPALEPLRSASAAMMKFASSCERDKKKARTDAEGAHNHTLQEHEAVAPTNRSRCMCSPSPAETAGSRTGGAAAVFSATATAIRCREIKADPRPRVATPICAGGRFSNP